MDSALAAKYPLARRAFETQDIFFTRASETLPKSLGTARDRVAMLVDKYVDGTPEEKEALIIAGAISLEPFSGSRMYGDPDYGTALDCVMIALIDAAKSPQSPVPPNIAPLITAVMIAKMEQTMEDVSSGLQPVTDAAVRASLKRAAVNDAICLPNLKNKELRDLYETTQFAYFAVLERAAERAKNLPPPPDPKP